MKLILRPIESLTLTLSGKTRKSNLVRLIFYWTFNCQEVSKRFHYLKFKIPTAWGWITSGFSFLIICQNILFECRMASAAAGVEQNESKIYEGIWKKNDSQKLQIYCHFNSHAVGRDSFCRYKLMTIRVKIKIWFLRKLRKLFIFFKYSKFTWWRMFAKILETRKF